jgi:hypothetical protein
MMTIADTAVNMLVELKRELALTPKDDVLVVAEHNSVELVAHVGSTVQEIVDYWHEKRHERALRDERLAPVRVAIRYLLGTLSKEDRLLVIKELAADPLKEGV